jgi:2-phospho-L-lactate/phosphoenolpyruvate guanylyltransferase
MRTAAILPVKHFAQAKRRLGESVAGELRDDLARAMVGDVLDALGAATSIQRTIVVTREDSVAAAAREIGALIVEDTAEASQSAAVSLGVARALVDGFERVVCVPGDCPALDPIELDALLERSGSSTVVIVPDRHGSGTNGLLLAPPDAISPSFGPDSRARHTALALAAGIAARIEQPPSLLLDIDTGEDLAVLRDRLSGEHIRASRTRAVLGLPVNPSAVSATAPV